VTRKKKARNEHKKPDRDLKKVAKFVPSLTVQKALPWTLMAVPGPKLEDPQNRASKRRNVCGGITGPP